MSLRTRILTLGIGSAVASLLLLSVPVTLALYDAARDEAEQDAVTLVQGIADYISTGTATQDDLDAVVDRGNGRRDDGDLAVVLADGTALGSERSDCLSVATTDPDSGEGRGRGDGDEAADLLPISTAQTADVAGGTLVTITTQDTAGTVAVCAYVSDASIRESVLERLVPLGWTAAVVLVVVAAAALLLARRLSRHLEDTAQTADRLTAGELDARVSTTGPTEVQRVGAALNRLADRIEELLRIERETAADLSHRLRTPLMTVRLDVEGLPASPRKDELDEHLAQLERTLTAVIQAARRPQREGAVPSSDAVAVVRERHEHWAPLLEDQGRATSLILDVDRDRTLVRSAREDLVATVDALLENAVAHTPEGVAVEVVATSRDDGLLQVDVRDHGPGVPPDALQRGRSDRGSSGLGLDIARACAEASGGRLEIARQDEWSVVRLLLGRP